MRYAVFRTKIQKVPVRKKNLGKTYTVYRIYLPTSLFKHTMLRDDRDLYVLLIQKDEPGEPVVVKVNDHVLNLND